MIQTRLSLLLALSFFALSPAVNATPGCKIAAFPGYQLEYCLYPGPGPTVVLETAQGTDMRVWTADFVERLNGFSTVLTYNRVGYGRSYLRGLPMHAPVTARGTTQRLHRLLLRLYPDRPVILVGHSIGGCMRSFLRAPIHNSWRCLC
jgi:pimeloyl-ACP methyl ester carboxylesterase